MRRREFIKQSALGSMLASSVFLNNSAVAQRKKPNIIFIMADDLGYGDLSCYGQKQFQTPHLDRMAAEGLKFTQFYSGSTVCAPARCSLMTGFHTGHTFIRGNKEIQPEGQYPIPADTVTVAKLMQAAGYKTGCIGKWGLGGPGSEGEPNKQGFDHFFGYLCQRQAHSFYPGHLWRNDEKVELDGETYSHDLMTHEVLEFIDQHKEEPFFLYVPYTIPHAEIHVPEDSINEFKGKFTETPFQGRGNYRAQETPFAAFAGMVTRMDRDVGSIIDALKQHGIDENTLVIFSSDNGPHQEGGHSPEFFDSNGPLRGIKRDLYEGGIRVPTIARWPSKINPGTTTEHISAMWDLLPTFAELGGAEVPGNTDGVSMKPLLTGNADQQPQHEFLYWEFHRSGGNDFKQAVRMGKWKAVRNGKDAPLELYDLDRDIGEQNNIAEEHPNIIEKIETYLKTARTESEIFPIHS